MVQGISHITLLVQDLERSAHLFVSLLDAKEVYSSDGKNFSYSREKFFVVGGVWMALMQGKPIERSYGHIAFKIDERDIPLYRERLEKLQLEVLPSRPRHAQEGESLYFYDYDNHLFELHTGTLERRLAFYQASN